MKQDIYEEWSDSGYILEKQQDLPLTMKEIREPKMGASVSKCCPRLGMIHTLGFRRET